jgi:hypothetical protein
MSDKPIEEGTSLLLIAQRVRRSADALLLAVSRYRRLFFGVSSHHPAMLPRDIDEGTSLLLFAQ